MLQMEILKRTGNQQQKKYGAVKVIYRYAYVLGRGF